jgi:alpha-L-fucosidase
LIEGKYQIRWKVFLDKPGKMKIDASYSFQGEKPNGTISVRAAGSTLKYDIIPTGKTVGEPGSNWQIDNFASNRVGEIDIPKKGIYEITLDVNAKKNEPVKLQWLWLQMN